MDADLQAYAAFYLTGAKAAPLAALDSGALRPALFSAYRDLTRLRFDFPLVLVDDDNDGDSDGVASLSGVIDALLERVATGADGDRIRAHVLALEQSIRQSVADGKHGTLSRLWELAAKPLTRKGADFADSLARARAVLDTDGELIDCNARLSERLFGHLWSRTQRARARRFNVGLKRLTLRLSEILQADIVHSDAGRSADALRQSFGSGPFDRFDFNTMSQLLQKSSPKHTLSKRRRERIEGLLLTLASQRFFPAAGLRHAAKAPYSFAFDNCTDALNAYRQRLPEAIALAKAMAIGELEIRGEYCETKHDPLFETFGENGLANDELALFPDYLVSLQASDLSGPEQATLNELLSADLPVKVLVRTDDVLEASPIDNGHVAFKLRSKRLASMTMGMNGVFVLQTPASSLFRLRRTIQRGLDANGPALFSVFSGASANTPGLPPYLVAAAALESRVFPIFSFDPSAGGTWAERFSLEGNPQPESDWPQRTLAYQDAQCQRLFEPAPFTLIDFVACDARYARHFATVPAASETTPLQPARHAIDAGRTTSVEAVPYIPMTDAQNRLHKVLVDEKLIREAVRCRAMWSNLQELGGIHNSYAERLLAEARDLAAASPVPAAATTPPGTSAVETATTEVPAETSAAPSSGEPYIETPRCASCNECIQVNGKMFAYDANQQASIVDPTAGTYAQLVEAAENCQVAIIHPGRPRNLNEPGLEALLKRAESFN